MKKGTYLLLSMALVLLTLTSCVYEKDSMRTCGPEDSELLIVNLNLTVPSASAGTRSAGDDHVLVQGNDDESYIDVEDGAYQVLIFDKDDVLVEGKLSEFGCKKNGVINSNGSVIYTLTAHLTLSGKEDKERLNKFKVMVLTN